MGSENTSVQLSLLRATSSKATYLGYIRLDSLAKGLKLVEGGGADSCDFLPLNMLMPVSFPRG